MDPKFYEKDFQPTGVEEIDFIRSPFYELAKGHIMDSKDAQDTIDKVGFKFEVMDDPLIEGILSERSRPSKEQAAFKRYADKSIADDKHKHIFQFPRGQPYRRINNAELFKVQKPDNHVDIMRRQKAFLSDKFFGPFDVKESNLKDLFSDTSSYQNPETNDKFPIFKEKLLTVIPNLNHDILVQLALHLAYDAKVNEKQIWHAIEDAALQSLHQMNMTQVAQLEWAVQELKPKYTSARLNTLLITRAIQHIESNAVTREELTYILQGFRKRQNKDLYMRIRKTIVQRRKAFFPLTKKGEEKQRSENLADFFLAFATNIPKKFGVYQQYYKDELNELLATYEQDLIEAVQDLDGEHLTRLAQALYILKTDEYENLWVAIEDKANEIKDKLDIYHVTNILRSFSHSQENKMSGNDKTFFNLEPKILKDIDKLQPRDLTTLMYAYSVRNVGNPELYKVFDKKLNQVADQLDYPSLFNAIYYMLFRENSNEEIWKKLVQATIKNEDILPIIYYKPFKASKFFIQAKFPHWEKDFVLDYTDKFWYAERYFNALRLEEYLSHDKKYLSFKSFLNVKCLVYPIPFMSKHNLFVLHYVFNDFKIAINLHLKQFLPPNRKEPSEMQKLPSKILKLEGWEVLDLSEKEFNDWLTPDKATNIKAWLKEAKERQVKKGVIEAKPKQYV